MPNCPNSAIYPNQTEGYVSLEDKIEFYDLKNKPRRLDNGWFETYRIALHTRRDDKTECVEMGLCVKDFNHGCVSIRAEAFISGHINKEMENEPAS